MIDPLKIVVCSLKSVKWLPGDEYTGESQLPGGKSPGSLDTPVVNTQESLDSPVMNTRGVDFLVYFEEA
jgi:hypothetical protein